MSQPIDLTKKSTVATYVDTVLLEAGRNRGLKGTNISSITDPNLRPYAGVARATKEQDKKYTRYYHALLGTVVNTCLALFSRKQTQAATESLQLSENYLTAACKLRWGWHKKLFELDTPLAEISKKIFDLALEVKEIDTMRKKEATNYSNCGILGLIGGAVFGIGISASSQWLKTMGKIVGFATLVFYGYTWISHRGDKDKIMEKYLTIGKFCEKIRHDLTYYDNNMKLTAKGSQYAPLFSELADTNYAPQLPKEEDLNTIKYTTESYKPLTTAEPAR